MLKSISYLLLIASLLLGCQPNTPKEEQLYLFLGQELADRKILLNGQNKDWHWLAFYQCYTIHQIPHEGREVDAIHSGTRKRKYPCSDSFHLSKMGYQPQQILQTIEKPRDTAFFDWQNKIPSSEWVVNTLADNIITKKLPSRTVLTSPSDSFEIEREEKYYKTTVVYWSAPYFFEDNTKAVIIEVGFKKPSSKADWRTYKNYVYQDDTWQLKDTIQIK